MVDIFMKNTASNRIYNVWHRNLMSGESNQFKIIKLNKKLRIVPLKEFQ